MSIYGGPLEGSLEVSSPALTVVSAAPASWPWRRAALFLAGAAQLITISALVGADPIPATSSSLLSAVAPAPVNLLVAASGIAVLAAGIAAQVAHADQAGHALAAAAPAASTG